MQFTRALDSIAIYINTSSGRLVAFVFCLALMVAVGSLSYWYNAVYLPRFDLPDPKDQKN